MGAEVLLWTLGGSLLASLLTALLGFDRLGEAARWTGKASLFGIAAIGTYGIILEKGIGAGLVVILALVIGAVALADS